MFLALPGRCSLMYCVVTDTKALYSLVFRTGDLLRRPCKWKFTSTSMLCFVQCSTVLPISVIRHGGRRGDVCSGRTADLILASFLEWDRRSHARIYGLENAIFRPLRTENKELRSLFSVLRDGNQGLENAIFRPWRTENELRWLFSVPGDGHLAHLMLLSVPRDGNHGLENAIFRPWMAENKELRSHGRTVSIVYAIFWP